MKILVVEDEHKIAHALKKGLEQEHFVVDVVYSGTEGYDFATTEEYDVILLDRMLPGMDGIEICKKLRKLQIHTPILMLTAKGQLTEKVEGLDSGADDYMTKPFAFTELLARVRALSRRPKTSLGSVLRVSDLTLDTKTYTVSRKGREIRLSQKEFTLLAYLMRHKNTILSKEQIINHVWDYDASVLPNIVEVYINKLREKIDAPFEEKKLIHTVRGFGYKLGDSYV